MSPVQVHADSVDGVSVVKLLGTIDGSSAPVAQEEIVPLLSPGCRVVLDLSGVDFMSSAGLRLMLLIFRQVTSQGGKVALTGLSDDIKDTMALTGFLDFFTMADTVDAALQSVKA